MGSDKELNKLAEALEGLIPAVEKLISVDLDGELLGSLSKKDRDEVEKFKQSSEVLREAEDMAAKFNASKWNL
jgi:Asp-tRNA(Asn)/Glu-tRNA(Gln) amidotransferase C subunit